MAVVPRFPSENLILPEFPPRNSLKCTQQSSALLPASFIAVQISITTKSYFIENYLHNKFNEFTEKFPHLSMPLTRPLLSSCLAISTMAVWSRLSSSAATISASYWGLPRLCLTCSSCSSQSHML